MTALISPDLFDRLVKHAIDSGTAASVAEAEALFRGYRLAVEIDASAAQDPVHQAALLTTVALGRRVFLGGVTVSGALDARLALSMPLGPTLAGAVVALGGALERRGDQSPTIIVGGGPGARREGFCVRTAASGWRGGTVPIHSDLQPAEGAAMPLSGMLAAALAVNEAYLHVSGGMLAAGRRVVGFSLWRPGPGADWLEADASEPALTYLPSRLWLIGLGHLGQAYLWGLGILPYRDPAELALVLQDVDLITVSTESTSILSESGMIGQRKTRAMAAWAVRRGFTASNSGAAVRGRLQAPAPGAGDRPVRARQRGGAPRPRPGGVRSRRRGGLGPRPSRLPHHAPSPAPRAATGGGNLEGGRRRRKGRGAAGLCQAGRRWGPRPMRDDAAGGQGGGRAVRRIDSGLPRAVGGASPAAWRRGPWAHRSRPSEPGAAHGVAPSRRLQPLQSRILNGRVIAADRMVW